jgi:hypothetical protein
MKHPIPYVALDDRLGFLGTSGAGKTYNAGTAVEILLTAAKARVVIVDPLGVWWGLRLLEDGKNPSGFNVAIFGGPHGDLPLTEHAGALIGETAATMAESCIINLSELKSRAAERRFMVAFLDALYRKASGEPFHLIVDEADLFAPQKPVGGDETLLSHMENIVRRGRIKGFIPWLISQRPAVLNKNVLSQVDGLLAFKLTSTQDRDALDSWIEGQADKATGKEIKDSLPTLQVGEGVVWIPGRGILEARARFPQKITFDSSRTPKRGEKVKERRLKPLDIGGLKDRLAQIEADAKDNDPKRLKSEIAALKAERSKLEKQVAAQGGTKDKPDHGALAAAEERGFERAKRQLSAAAEKETQSKIVEALESIKAAFFPAAQAIDTAIKEAKKERPDLRAQVTFTPSTPAAAPHAAVPRQAPATRAAAEANGALPIGEKRILIAVAQYPDGVTRDQLTVLTGYKRSSRDAYLQRLGNRGYVETTGSGIIASQAGIDALGSSYEPLPVGTALQDYWMARLPEGERRILSELIQVYPNPLERNTLDELTGYKRSSRDAYLQRLSSRRLVTAERGSVRASDLLFA